MPTSIITTDDLHEFKLELIDDIKRLLAEQSKRQLKTYLKSAEVMSLLKISSGTLQNLRLNGTIPYTRIGGIIYYSAEEIQAVMIENKVDIDKNM
ncbi:helix-turn-helix domain-containing protein [Formosa algae]|uniref:helix-turn-helix domain-containing protein n=1 Tax=Formosa algae TaxID=225843 RepID=UPI000CCF5BE3|nr:helix-turn-helix domain-containing protein [Formosa algae]PNW27419.1 DNA-binding protein [Formosa algae]